ncbi:MAG: NACHT domain-containing protein [Clostridiales bacterium]|nr:NACHT domain-containing protein [Clostridiales bacterium]
MTDVELVGTLTKTIDPSCEYASSEGTAVSRLLSCEQNLSNGQARRVGQRTRTDHSEFESGYGTNRLSDVVGCALKADYREVAIKIRENVLPLLDADRKNLIVPAVFSIIEEDTVIDNEKKESFQKYVGENKENLIARREIDLSELIAKLLIYVAAAVTNTEGKDSAKKINKAYVDKYRVNLSEFQIIEGDAFGNSNTRNLSMNGNKSIELYLEKIRDKYGSVRTLLSPYHQTPLYNFYVCNDIVRKIPVQGKFGNTYITETIHEATTEDLAACSSFVIIIGTGGIGKSMMIRHLLLDAIERYPKEGIVPIFVMLKDYDVNSGTLFDYLFTRIKNYGTGITQSQLQSLLNSGKCLLLLDGLDEIGTKFADAFEQALEDFTDLYPDNQYVVSSRPHRTFSAYSRFTILKVSPFTKTQALSLVDKLECSEVDYPIKKEFREKLESTFYVTHRQFAENPLLLTIMYMTYELFRDVPSKMHLFYRNAYNALSQSHDALKGLKRPSETGLTADDFAEWFAEFCARTYYDEKYEFTEYEFEEYFNNLSTHEKYPEIHVVAKSFRIDLCENLCLMYYDSGKYYFTHRSFQEYFCAVYFSKQKDRTLEGVGDFFDNLRSRNYGDKTFPMLYDMIPGKIDEYVFIPYLKKLFDECDAAGGYWSFLEAMYPQIEYTVGDTEFEADMAPSSFIYEFIRSTFFDAPYNFEGLPKNSAFLREKYAYVHDDNTGEETLIRTNEISVDYEREYGRPDVVGWMYEINISRLLQKKFLYKDMMAAMDADDFSLKREYNAARQCLNKLLDNQKPRGQGFFANFN